MSSKERKRVIDEIVAFVPGSPDTLTCQVLYNLAYEVPEDGTILHLSCGEGRGTLVMAKAIEEAERMNDFIIAADTHITDPRSNTPYEDGTLNRFVANIRKFRAEGFVIPIIGGPYKIAKLLSKRSVNLVVLQTPDFFAARDDALASSIELALSVVRKNGHIAVCAPIGPDNTEFFAFVDSRCQSSEMRKVFTNSDRLRVYEFVGKREESTSGEEEILPSPRPVGRPPKGATRP